jgi:prolyl-tRNA editing enzyme YbaK/EbsC (Cys-tRNA(Pro) deacylase)
VTDWPEAVDRVASFLWEAGAEARLEEFASSTPTAREAAEAIGCEPAQIVKSLLFDCDGRPVVVLVPGDRRADGAKIARAIGCASARVAAPDQVERATGFPPGAVAPFPLPGVERVLMERGLLSHDVVWVGAGSTHHLAGLAPTELRRLARADAMDAIQVGT